MWASIFMCYVCASQSKLQIFYSLHFVFMMKFFPVLLPSSEKVWNLGKATETVPAVIQEIARHILNIVILFLVIILVENLLEDWVSKFKRRVTATDSRVSFCFSLHWRHPKNLCGIEVK